MIYRVCDMGTGFLKQSISKCDVSVLKLIPKLRWEWQYHTHSQLSAEEQGLVEAINKHLSSVEMD